MKSSNIVVSLILSIAQVSYSQGVNQETCSVDLQIPDHLCLNNDDDNDSDAEDLGESSVTDEDDLGSGSISITVSSEFSGTVTVSFESGGAKVGSKAWKDETKSEAHPLSWKITDGVLDTEPPADFYLEGIETSDAKDDVVMKAELTGTGEDGECEAEDTQETTVYELEVKKEVVSGNMLDMEKIKVIDLQTSEKVAIRTKLAVEIKPAATVKYNWIVSGSRIKTYEHDIDEDSQHKPIDLEVADLKDTDVIKFFWKDEGNPLVVTVETEGDVECKSEIEFDVTHESDPNKEIYAQDMKVDPERRNPDGETLLYKTLTSHENWHGGANMANGDQPVQSTPGLTAPGWGDVGTWVTPNTYNGSAFLNWHREFIDAHYEWRSTFNMPPLGGNPGGPARPEYLKVLPGAGANLESRVYGYVRLGEFQNLIELGRDVVAPWHNSGHIDLSSVDSIMASLKSPNAKDNIFWRWHEQVDLPRADWAVDQAAVSTTTPAANASINGAFPATIRVAFNKRVSLGIGRAQNTIKLTAGALTVDGSAATTVVDTNLGGTYFQVYDFSGYTAPTTKKKVSIGLAGTASYAATTFDVDYDPASP